MSKRIHSLANSQLPRLRRLFAIIVLGLSAVGTSGCAHSFLQMPKVPFVGPWSANEQEMAEAAQKASLEGKDDIQQAGYTETDKAGKRSYSYNPEPENYEDTLWGRLKRNLTPGWTETRKDKLAFTPPEAQEQFEVAKALYEATEYEQAEKTLKTLVKKYAHTPIHQEALFLIAESRFHQRRYAWAQDSYDELFKQYPTTRYSDVATKRLFAIASTWLGQPDFVTSDQVTLVNLEEPSQNPTKIDGDHMPTNLALVPNLIDRSRPVFDTEGRAIQALKSIWINDPVGPLADDALMMTASYYLRRGRYVEADKVFQTLRDEYPDSPHLQDAFLLGSHVKLLAYQGPNYDGKSLTGAESLKRSMLQLYPDSPHADRLHYELGEIYDANARRDWEKVVFWLKKRKPHSAAVYSNLIIEQYPDTEYAAKARQVLADLDNEDRSFLWADYVQTDAAGNQQLSDAIQVEQPSTPGRLNPAATPIER